MRNTHRSRVVSTLLSLFGVFVMVIGVGPASQERTVRALRTLNESQTDTLAHELGSSWHAAGPAVVDFGPSDPNGSVDGLDQWLAQQKAVAAPRARTARSAVTDRRKLVVLRVGFSGMTMQRYTDAELMTRWFDPINALFRKMSNGNFNGWDVTIVSQVTLPNAQSYYTVTDSAGATALYNDTTSNVQTVIDDTLAASDESVAEPLIEDADTVLILAANANAQRIRAFNSKARSFLFPFPDLPDVKNMAFIDEGGSRDEQLQWGALAHELAHALQAYSGDAAWDIMHPSNYNSAFELLDANYPGQIGAYLKGQTMASWLPNPQTITISSDGKSQSDSYCLNPIELDYHTNPTPQILKINITDTLYYVVSVRYELNGDELNSWNTTNRGIPDEGVLIERVITGGNQWDDIDGDGVNDAGETDTWRVLVRGRPNGSGVQDKNALWKVGDTFSNATDGSSANVADGLSISVVAAPPSNPMQRCLRVTFGAGSTQPDVGIRPWRQAPGETYETTDIWVDSPLNGYGTYRYGYWNDLDGNSVPRGNGDDPAIGSINRLYARVHNFGSANATNVKVQFQNTNPLGVGVQNNAWVNTGPVIDSSRFPGLALIPPHQYVDVYVDWNPTVTLTAEQIAAGTFSFHSCVRLTIASVAGETITGNQDGDQEQENIRNFEATPAVSPVFQHAFDVTNTSVIRNKLLHVSTSGNIPSGWEVAINGGTTDIPLAPSTSVTVPVTVTAAGTSVLGSQFTLAIGVIENRLLNNPTIGPDPLDRTHPDELAVGGMDFSVNVVAPTAIDCRAYGRGTRIEAHGALDGFEGIHQAGTPLRVYAQLYDTNKVPIPLDDRAKADVGANGAFVANFSTISDQKTQPAVPVFVRCLFPGTNLLASSGSDFIPIDYAALPPAPTPEPWVASQFHFGKALNQFLPPADGYSDRVGVYAPTARVFNCLAGRCPTLVEGIHGRAVQFNDSIDSYLVSGSSLALGNVFSVSVWARRISANRAETLISHGNTLLRGRLFHLGFNELGNIVCSTYDDDVVSERRIQDTDWHEYRCDVDGADRALHIDGVLDTRATSASVAAYPTNSFILLGRRADRADSFNGVIDEVNIFQSLSADADLLYTKPGQDIIGYTPMSHLTFNDIDITQGHETIACGGAACPVISYPDREVDYRPSERVAAMRLQTNRALTVTSDVPVAPGTDSTLMFWGRFDALTLPSPIVTSSQLGRPRIAIGSSGVINYANLAYTWPTESEGGQGTSAPLPSDWHHYAFVKNGTLLVLYIDGNRVAEETALPGLLPFRVATTSSIAIGFTGGGGGGELAGFELATSALSGVQITQRYASGIPGAFVSPTRTVTESPTALPASATMTGLPSATPTRTVPFLMATRTELALRATATAFANKWATETHAVPATLTKQVLLNSTALASLATKWAQISLTEQAIGRTATAAAMKAQTRTATPVRIVITFAPKLPTLTLLASLTATRTATATMTPNARFTATKTRTATAIASATSTASLTPTASLSPTTPPTRTKILVTNTLQPSPTGAGASKSPTVTTISKTPTRTATSAPTLTPNPFGVQTQTFASLPLALRARALQHIADHKGDVGTDWSTLYLSNDVVPLYRPDLGCCETPAYYELGLFSDATRSKAAGYLILTNDDPALLSPNDTTPHDFPISHWDSKGEALSKVLLKTLPTTGGTVTLWKLDTLGYVAVRNNIVVNQIGNIPALIDGLSKETFSAYSSGEAALSELQYAPNGGVGVDDSAYKYAGAVVTTKGPQKKDVLGIWSYSTVDITGNFKSYISGYPEAFAPLLAQLRASTTRLWNIEHNRAPEPGVWSIPAPASASTSVIVPARLSLTTPLRVTDPSAMLTTAPVLTTGVGEYQRLTISTRPLGTGELPVARVELTDIAGAVLTYEFHLIDNNTTRVAVPVLPRSRAARAWSGWSTWVAGNEAEQRDYNQFSTGGCASGCGPTAWMMLFGWADAKSIYPPVSGQLWRRWNVYRAGGGNTGSGTSADVGTVLGGIAHRQNTDGNENNAILYLRSVVNTFCFSRSGATPPWDMQGARNYLAYVGTGMGMTESHNVVGFHEDSIRSYARDEIALNRRPVVIGTGLLAHYPLAWKYQYRSRPEEWNEGWFDGDDVVLEEQFYVNNGWLGRGGDGWISAGTWFAGRVSP